MSNHQAAQRAAVKLLPTPWHDLTAVRRWSRTDPAISTCLDQKCSPTRSFAHRAGSWRYGDSGRSAWFASAEKNASSDCSGESMAELLKPVAQPHGLESLSHAAEHFGRPRLVELEPAFLHASLQR